MDRVLLAATPLAALVCGALFGLKPTYGAAAAVAVAGAAVALVSPPTLALLAVASLAIAPEWIEGITPVADDGNILRMHHLVVVAAFLPLLLRGLRDKVIPLPFLAYAITFVLSYTLVQRETGLNLGNSLLALLTLSFGWLVAHVRWKREEVLPALYVIAALPVISVAVGLLLQLAHLHSLIGVDADGASRLQGAGIPPYLSFLSVVGIAAGVLLHRLGDARWGLIVIGASCLTLAGTGTRGGFIAAVIILFPWGISVAFGGKPAGPVLVLRVLALVAVAGVALAIAVPPLLARTETSATPGGGINSSGRFEAWSYFYGQTARSPELGLGLGATPYITQGVRDDVVGVFKAAHNEYLRLYVEGGVIGLLLTVVGIVILLWQVYRRLRPGYRRDFACLCFAFAVYSLTDNTSYFGFFIPFGVLVAVYATIGPASGPEAARPSRALTTS